jgi:ribosomal-protein-alanine N-acetyltransferase
MEVAEIGYELLPEFQGKGIMQEAVAKIIEFCFQALKLKSLEACADMNNRPSIKLLEKFNFVKTGLSRHNEIIYRLTSSTV